MFSFPLTRLRWTACRKRDFSWIRLESACFQIRSPSWWVLTVTLQISSPQQLATDAVKRLALGDTRAVPAGVYAKEYLEQNGVWEAVKDRVVPTENVRAALAAVESGNVDAGIVYKTDATISKAVKIAYVVTPLEGPRISYPIAITKNSGHPDAANRFVAYLGTEAALAVFRKYGFLVGDRALP